MPQPAITLRAITPDDYVPIIEVVDAWWGGRAMRDMLPRLFFTHIKNTSVIAVHEQQRVGFLIGLLSQSYADEAYIHFVGVHPDYRQAGLGRLLYERFFDVVRQHGRSLVRCVTAPINKTSIAFHTHMGFVMQPSPYQIDGIPIARDYDGHNGDRVLFVKTL